MRKKRSECPFSRSLDIWGDKWSLLIIRDIIFLEKNTYGDFLKSPEGISTNILANRLQQLEEHGIIEKMEHPDSKTKFLYKLTPKGIGLIPMMADMYLWADSYLDKDEQEQLPDIMKRKLEVLKENRAQGIKNLADKLS